jgi:peptidoglycan/LPS O-acetylase OafA/YrhL
VDESPPSIQAGPRFRLGHRASLDGLRGVAVLAVVFHHGHLFKYGRGGFLGVDLFFVLSGFLITCLLVQEWEETDWVRLPAFYTRRVLRLYPALLAIVLVVGAYSYATLPSDQHASLAVHLASVLAYVSNFVHGGTGRVLGHTWSLSVEEQFYLLWPPCLLLMLRSGVSRRTIHAIVVAAILLVAAHRAVDFSAHDWSSLDELLWRAYVKPDMRLDAPLMGCLSALPIGWGHAPRLGAWVALLAGLVFGGGVFIIWIGWPWLYLGGFTVMAVAAAVLLLYGVQRESSIWALPEAVPAPLDRGSLLFAVLVACPNLRCLGPLGRCAPGPFL